MTFAKSITATETIIISYRTDRAYSDLSTGWTTLVTLDSTGENGEVTTSFQTSSVDSGLVFNSIQYRVALARGSTNTNTPDLQALVTAYEILTSGNWVWTFSVIIDGEIDGNTAQQQAANLETLLESDTLVPLLFRKGSTETHYVRCRLLDSSIETGEKFSGSFVIQAIEI
ncbi:MAG: hypothetical protein WC822_05330 [Candidatus Paceibacterota bacterium]